MEEFTETPSLEVFKRELVKTFVGLNHPALMKRDGLDKASCPAVSYRFPCRDE